MVFSLEDFVGLAQRRHFFALPLVRKEKLLRVLLLRLRQLRFKLGEAPLRCERCNLFSLEFLDLLRRLLELLGEFGYEAILLDELLQNGLAELLAL